MLSSEYSIQNVFFQVTADKKFSDCLKNTVIQVILLMRILSMQSTIKKGVTL